MGNNTFFIILAGYILIISIVAIIATISDKSKAKKGQWRTPEATLLIISALGGSVAMLLTMKKIRHKTKHKKFMIGIPAIIIVQMLVIALLVFKFVVLAQNQ